MCTDTARMQECSQECQIQYGMVWYGMSDSEIPVEGSYLQIFILFAKIQVHMYWSTRLQLVYNDKGPRS